MISARRLYTEILRDAGCSGYVSLYDVHASADRATRRRVVAHGRVQGVFFRDSVSRRAGSVGVSGWVCNRRDGTVEAVFEGAPDAVESMVRYCREGPGHADVSELEVFDGEPEGLSGFEVR